MIADVSLQEAIIACGQLGATKTNDLMNGLWIFQIQSKWSVFSRRLPEICLIRSVRGDTSHWTVKAADMEYNPALDEPNEFHVSNLVNPRTIIEINPNETGAG